MVIMALDIFPLEVWDVLLDSLAAEDAYSTYLAFPDLRTETIISKKLAKWMFYMVAHRIYASAWWLTQEDILDCRLVCRQWCEGIDRIVQFDPRHFAYPYNSEAGLLPLLNANPFQILPCGMLGRSPAFRNVEILQKFQATMNGDIRNPFPFRSLRLIKSRDWEGREETFLGITPFWKTSLDFLQIYGKHIWSLDIWSGESDRTSIVRFLLQSLHFAPNLKSLLVGGSGPASGMGNEQMIEIVEELSGSLPLMHHLEYIYFGLAPESLTSRLMNIYGGQLRKITIFREIWRECYSGLFPSLTDLMLLCGSMTDISKVLTTIVSPLLVKLFIDVGQLDMDSRRLSYSTIIPTLSRFPCLDNLTLGRLDRSHSTCFPVMDPISKVTIHNIRIPSVKTLNIHWEALAMNLDLLMCFPYLKNVSVYLPLAHVSFYEESHLLWEVACPRLEFVATYGYKYGTNYCCHYQEFNRDYYNWKKASRPERSGDNQDDNVLDGIDGLFIE